MRPTKEEKALGRAIMELMADSPLDDPYACMSVLMNVVGIMVSSIECLECRRATCEEIRDNWSEAIAGVMKAPSKDDPDHQHRWVH